MSDRRLSFSLRGLFTLTTVVAVLVGLGVRFPIFGEICSMMVGPIVFTVVVAYLMNNHPLWLIRSVLVLFGTCIALGSIGWWMESRAKHDETEWLSLAMLDALALLFYYIAWRVKPAGSPPPAVPQTAQHLQKQ
jgi:hypothetical protein